MRFITRETIEQEAQKVLQQTNAFRMPVPIELVAHRMNLTVEAASLGEEVSGILILDNGRGTIGYSSEQPHVRQRFSIAHELAHYHLHRNESGAPKLFIDTTKYVAVFLRGEHSSTGEHAREIQANMFAAALLMPEALLRNEIKSSDYDLLDEEELCERLASKFQVSTQAMSIRLTTLEILKL